MIVKKIKTGNDSFILCYSVRKKRNKKQKYSVFCHFRKQKLMNEREHKVYLFCYFFPPIPVAVNAESWAEKKSAIISNHHIEALAKTISIGLTIGQK